MALPSIPLLLVIISITSPSLASARFDAPHDFPKSSLDAPHDSSHSYTKELYIVYMGGLPEASPLDVAVSSHVALLSTSLGISEIESQGLLITSYHKSFNGFAAMLTQKEAQVLEGNLGVVSVFKSKKKKLLTTRSWDFLGLNSSSPRRFNSESQVIIGVLDTGIWPENPMFNDTGLGPIPSKWKGACIPGENFTTKNCNKKLIGAKYFYKGATINDDIDYLSARDSEGHGSHTSSTAGGARVKGASLYGLAEGTARGGVPAARLAMYKVCWSDGCADVDILAGFDEALHDGVDLVSISLGYFVPLPYDQDPIAIGALHAMRKGVVVAAAAGNEGPILPATNIAPWIITVAASTIDRQFDSPVVLGNNVTIMGIGVNTFVLKDNWYPLISGAKGDPKDGTLLCDILDPKLVAGKIVYCESGDSDITVLESNGSGLILSNFDDSTAFSFVVSTSVVNNSEGQYILNYINTTRDPIAKILPCDVVTNKFAPLLASFSSRGPHSFTPSIMKPDISAPGVDILAAWSQNASVTGDPAYLDPRFPQFNIISGTSMATPHVTGAAAYIKSMHPSWSPAAIKSALMTTATPFDPTHDENKDLEFGYGAGQINPTKAIDPGLVYDISFTDYLIFLCENGYNSTQVRLISGDNFACPTNSNVPLDLNYPAIVGSFTLESKNFWYNTTRTLKNVGSPPNMTYPAIMEVPFGMEVVVEPLILSFAAYNEEKSYKVAVRACKIDNASNSILSASLFWASKKYSIKTPIVAFLVPS